MQECLARLDALGMDYEIIRHEPLTTMQECQKAEKELGVRVPRNIFLCTRSQSDFALLTLPAEAAFRTSRVSRQAKTSRLSFAPEDKLSEMLGTFPGAVSPLGLMFDTAGRVSFLMDRQLLSEEYLGFHPVDNSATVKIRTRALLDVFLPACGHTVAFINTQDE